MSGFTEKINQRKFGLIFGFILPILTLLILWKWKLDDKTLKQFLVFIKNSSSLQTNLLIFSLIPNLVLFYFSNFQLRINKFTYGLVLSTVSLTIFIAIIILLL